MATAQTQFYKGTILIGGNQYPCQPPDSLTVPKNFIIPPIIGNNWQFNYAEGFQNPFVDINFIVRDKTTEVMSSTFLNYFFTRSSDAAFDTSVISSGVAFWDGRSGFTLTGAKADSFSISCSKGSALNFTARFCFTTISALGSAPTFTAWDNTRPLVFSDVNFTGGLANIVWQFALSFSNNHNPDMSLNGSAFPAAQNAALQTAGMQFTVQANDTVPDNNPVPMSLTPVTLAIAGANVTRNFVLNNPIDNTPNNRAIPAGRVMRSHQYIALGADGETTPPLTFS